MDPNQSSNNSDVYTPYDGSGSSGGGSGSGSSDSSGGGSWYGGLFSTVKDLAKEGTSIYSNIVGHPNQVATVPVASPGAKMDFSKYIPLVVGAVVVLVLIMFLAGRKR